MSGFNYSPLTGFSFPSPRPHQADVDANADADAEFLADKFIDIRGGIHLTQREMWEANAQIKEANGEVACERKLDEPEKK